MRQLVPVATCDRCGDSIDPEVRAAILEISPPYDTSTTLRFSGDLCNACSVELLMSINSAIDGYLETDHGRRPRMQKASKTGSGAKRLKPVSASAAIKPLKAAKKPRSLSWDPNVPVTDRTCSLCDTVTRTRGALGNHLSRIHGTTFRALGENKPSGKPSHRR